MKLAALLPVPFSTLSRLISTVSSYCGSEPSLLRPKRVHVVVRAGDVLRLALLAPELRFPIDVNATVIARTLCPATVLVRYELADLSQIECALGQLYQRSPATLPIALEVATFRSRRCRMAGLSRDGATFKVLGELSPYDCAPDTAVRLQLPHQDGRVDLPGRVTWVTPRWDRSFMHMSFAGVAQGSRRTLDDIVYRFRLGAAPWRPRLLAPGLWRAAVISAS